MEPPQPRRFRPEDLAFLERLRELLNRHDPIGLLALGAPEDEYDAERGTIAPKLEACTNVEDVLDLVHGEFCVGAPSFAPGEGWGTDTVCESRRGAIRPPPAA